MELYGFGTRDGSVGKASRDNIAYLLDDTSAHDDNTCMVAVTLLAGRPSAVEPRALKSVIDRRLSALVPAPRRGSELEAAMRYALLAPGKRIRPILTVLASCEIGDAGLRALDAGCALEMVHAASLILDDLPAMDNAAERRGQPATHVKFGEDVAMLSAISLLSAAYGTVAAMDCVDAQTRTTLVGILAQAVGVAGLAGGQYADLRPKTLRDARDAADANHRKTGVLFVAAVDMAIAIERVEPVEAAPLRACATELGQAYQLLDDLVDSTQAANSGRFEDFGKVTVMSLVGHEEARLRLRRHVDKAVAALKPSGPMSLFMRRLFETDTLSTVSA